MAGDDQDEPDDNIVPVEEGIELIRAFGRIEHANLRRKIINLASLVVDARTGGLLTHPGSTTISGDSFR